MESTRGERAGRGLIAAGVATFVAAFSHSLADGSPAPLLGVLLALVLAAPVCVALAGRSLSWARLSIAVGASQFAFHGLLLVGLGEGSFGWPASGAAHLHAAAAAMTSTAASPALEAVAHTEHATPAMWIAHVCAAVITVLALGAGERAVVAILGLVRLARVSALLRWSPRAFGDPEPIPETWRLSMPRLAVLTVMRLRGPPVAA